MFILKQVLHTNQDHFKAEDIFFVGRYLMRYMAVLPLLLVGTVFARDYSGVGATLDSPLRQIAEVAAGKAAVGGQLSSHFQRSKTGEIRIYVYVDPVTDAIVLALEAAGARIERLAQDLGIVEVWATAGVLKTLALVEGVVRLQSVPPPQIRTGSRLSQGDAILGADSARLLGFDGSGVKVGVISDGVTNIATAKASGDLPQAVTVLDAGSGDEGTAMLEIVHDLAPGADLLFHGVIGSSLDMRDAIRALAQAGADVIVDDIGLYDQPMFQDGALAKVVDEVFDGGAFYCSAAGNQASEHYLGDYSDADGAGPSKLHAWSGSDTTLALSVPSGGSVNVFVQWNDLWGASDNDYDVFLYGNTALTQLLAQSDGSQAGNHLPYEWLSYDNTSESSKTVYLVVEAWRAEPRRLKVFAWGDVTWLEHTVTSGSTFGHAVARGAIGVAAISAQDFGHDTAEPYSSRGPVEIYFPQPETRQKPDLAAVDGVSITGAGGFPTTFYGTSAAAPHVAAIAALVRQAFPKLDPSEVQTLLRGTAVEFGSPEWDSALGYGRVDALAAVQGVPLETIWIDSATGINGDQISINVYTTADSLFSAQIGFTFDADFLSADSGLVISSLFDTAPLAYVVANVTGDSVLISLTSQIKTAVPSGIIATLNLTLAADAPLGAVLPLLLLPAPNTNLDELNVVTEDGAVTVIRPMFGDVTADGTISALDASVILRFTVNLVTTIDTILADVSGNGYVSALDASFVLRRTVDSSLPFPVEGVARLSDHSAAASATLMESEGGWLVTLTGPQVWGAELVLETGGDITSASVGGTPWLGTAVEDGRLLISAAWMGPPSTERVLTISGISDAPRLTNATVNETHVALGVPQNARLLPLAPNPFNPATDISFELEQPSDIRLMIVNPLGQIVRTVANGDRPAGRHSVVWDGRDDQGREVASGVYIVRLVAGPMAVNSRAVLLR